MIAHLTFKSLKNRFLTTTLCILSIALSTALFLGVERLRSGAREGFTNTLSQTDLLVGAPSGPLQLLLYTIFHMGQPTNNIRMSSYLDFKNNSLVKWTIPISLGDAYKGYRVVGTDESFLKYYRYRGERELKLKQGKNFSGLFDVVLGADVAKSLGHKLGDTLIISHGLGKEAILKHEHSPFKVTGILSPTQTPVDRGVYITLEGMEAIHMGWESGVPNKEDLPDFNNLQRDKIKVHQITSFLLGANSRIYTLRLRHMISQYKEEPLMAIIPALTLQELWQTLSHVEKALSIIGFCVLLVSMIGIVISLYTSLNERRREMAILRSLGAHGRTIVTLLLSESLLLVSSGILLGLIFLYGLLLLLGPYLENEFSLTLPLQWPLLQEWLILGAIIIMGTMAGLIPAIKAYRNSLHDGLAVKS